MSVRNRIKVIKCKDFQDAEDKVNDFLANDPDIEQLVNMQFMLEYSTVLVEYYVSCKCMNENSNNENNIISAASYGLSNNNDPFTNYWLSLMSSVCCWPLQNQRLF